MRPTVVVHLKVLGVCAVNVITGGTHPTVVDQDRYHLRPLTHAPEIGAVRLNSTPDSDVPKAVNDVRSRASARKTGAGIWRRIYGADFWSVCQGH